MLAAQAQALKKKKALTCTLTRASGTLGIALSDNYVTSITPGGAAAKEGTLQVGDMITEVIVVLCRAK